MRAAVVLPWRGPDVREPFRRLAPFVAAPLLLSAASLPAHAGFVASVSGDAQIIAAPASSVPGALVSNDLQVWDETTGKIKSNLTLDLGGQPGNYDGLTNYTPLNTTLTAGTAYDSVMVQLDPTSPYSDVAGDGQHHLYEQDHRHRAVRRNSARTPAISTVIRRRFIRPGCPTCFCKRAASTTRMPTCFPFRPTVKR